MRPSLSEADECTAVHVWAQSSLPGCVCAKVMMSVGRCEGLQLVAAAAWVPQPALQAPLRQAPLARQAAEAPCP